MRTGRISLVCACALALAGLASTARSAAAQPLRTAIYLDAETEAAPGQRALFDRVRRTGATVIRITIDWRAVAPSSRPEQWEPANPADPHYRWGTYDAAIRNAVAHGFEPLVTILQAPDWAQPFAPGPPVSFRPDPVAFGQFATAAATRYSGRFEGLPRVRWWQAWNEPNISLYLQPQLVNRQPVAPRLYRRMLNEFAAAVRSVNPDNIVVAGGLAPFHDVHSSIQDQDPDWGPLSFMRALLCVSKDLRPTCDDGTSFDVWATHPYTSGGPLHHAVLENDVSLGDLPEMRQTLDAAVKAGHVDSRMPVQFWVTEFSWDSKPPDPCGVPLSLLAHWVPEALYRMWANGISLVVWFLLEDQPLSNFYQSGVFFRPAAGAAVRPKPFLEGLRFPFVALRRGRGVYVWMRTPAGKPARLIVEQRKRRAWKKVAALTSTSEGIAQKVLRAKPVGSFRARMFPTNERSLPFSMVVPRDHFYNPFGLTEPLEPGSTPNCR